MKKKPSEKEAEKVSQKLASKPDPIEPKIQKFQKREVNASKPKIQPVIAPKKPVNKFMSLFSGGKNPFAKAVNKSKTLIATPSKFEIRSKP